MTKKSRKKSVAVVTVLSIAIRHFMHDIVLIHHLHVSICRGSAAQKCVPPSAKHS